MSGRIIPVKTGHYRAWWEKDGVDDDNVIEYDANEKNEQIKMNNSPVKEHVKNEQIKMNNSPVKEHVKQHTALNGTKPAKKQLHHEDEINILENLATNLVSDECLLKERKSSMHFVQKSPKDFKCKETWIKSQEGLGGFKGKYKVRKNISQSEYPNNYLSSSSSVQNNDQFALYQNQYVNDCKDSKELFPSTSERKTHQGKKQSLKYRTQISGDRYNEILKILYGVERNLESIGNETLDVHCKSRKSVVRISSVFSEKSFTSISTRKKSRSKKKLKKSNCNISASKIVSNFSNASHKRSLKYNQQHLFRNHQCDNDITGFKFPEQSCSRFAASDKRSNYARLGVSRCEVINCIQCPCCVFHTSNTPSSSSDKEHEDSSSSIPLSEHTSIQPVIEKENSAVMYGSKYLQKFVSHSKQLHLESESFDKTLKKIINCPQVGVLDEEQNTEYTNSDYHPTNISLKDVGTNTSPNLECNTESHLGQTYASTKVTNTLTSTKSIISCNDSRCETSRGTVQQKYFGTITKSKNSNSSNTNEYLSSCTEPEIVIQYHPSSSGKEARKTCLTTEECGMGIKMNTFNPIESNSSSSRTSGKYNRERINLNRSNRSLKMDDSTDSNASNSSYIPKTGKSRIEAYITPDISENSRIDQAKGKHCDNACKASGRSLFDTVEIIEKGSTGIAAKEKLASFNSGSAMSKMLYDTSSMIIAENKDVAIVDRPLQGEQKNKVEKPLVHQTEHSTYHFKDVSKQKLVNFNLGNEMTDTLYGTTYLKENRSHMHMRIQRSKSKSPLQSNSAYITDSDVKSKESIDTSLSSTVSKEMVTVKPIENNGRIYQDKYFLTHSSSALVAKNQNIPLEQTLHHINISTVDHSKEETVSPEIYVCTAPTTLTPNMNYMNNNIPNSFQMGNNIFQNQIPFVCYPVGVGIVGPSGLNPNLYNNMNFAQFLSQNTVIPQAPSVTIKESVAIENNNPHNTEEIINRSPVENIMSSEDRGYMCSDNNKAGSTRYTSAGQISNSNTSKLNQSSTLQTRENNLECESSKTISRPSCPARLAKTFAHESLSGQNVASILYGEYEEPMKPYNTNTNYISENHGSYKWSKSDYISEAKQENIPGGIQNRLGASGPSTFQTSKDKVAERNISYRKPKGIVPGLEDITD